MGLSRFGDRMKKELGIGILLMVLFVVLRLLNPRFLSPINLQNLSDLVGIYGIFSIGLGIIIITGGIDLSVGSVFALQGVLLSLMLVQSHWPWPIATLAAIACVVLLGLFHGLLVSVVNMQ